MQRGGGGHFSLLKVKISETRYRELGQEGAALGDECLMLEFLAGVLMVWIPVYTCKACEGLWIVHLNARNLLPTGGYSDPDISTVSCTHINLYSYNIFRADRVKQGIIVSIYDEKLF